MHLYDCALCRGKYVNGSYKARGVLWIQITLFLGGVAGAKSSEIPGG